MKLFTKIQFSSLFFSLVLGLSACGQNNPGGLECGNGTVEDVEQCDDGNTISGDGCSEACELEDECGESCQAEQIDAYVQGLSKLPVEENTGPTFGTPSAPTVDPVNFDYDCTTQEFTQIQKNVEISSFSANSSNLFPGALIRGDSVSNDLIDPVVLPLKPVEFSVSLQNLNGPSSGTMQTPNIVQFREKRNAILAAGVNGDVVVSSQPEVIQVNSKEELSIALGVDVKKASVDVGADFNFDSSEERSHFIVRIKQILYTVDTVLPSKPSDLIASGVSAEEVQARFDDENPAMYVQQIIYGRLIYFTFDSRVSSTELKAALNFTFSGDAQVDATAALDFNQILSETTIKGHVIGGSAGADLSQLLGNSIANVQAFIQQNTVFPADDFNNFGDIIGFKLGYLSDNSTAALSFGGTTTIRECFRARQKVDVELLGIEAISDGIELGNELEIYGSITAKGIGNGGGFGGFGSGLVTLFSRPQSTPVSILLGEAFGFTLDEITQDPEVDSLQIGQVTVDVANGGTLGLTVALDEDDAGSNDEALDASKNLTASQGFRGVRTLQTNNSGTQANVHFRLTPVFE